jgi:MoaA/NifB/PqqE/SkfB family radical SAM enzyme
MNMQQTLIELEKKFNIVGQINLNELDLIPIYRHADWINSKLTEIYQSVYEYNQRIVVTAEYTQWDTKLSDILQLLHVQLNAVDISNFFVVLVAPKLQELADALDWINVNVNKDPVPIQLITYPLHTIYNYNSSDPLKIELSTLPKDEKYLLTDSKTFCMYPWIHIHAYPTGQAYACCMSEMTHPIGNTRNNTLKEIWNGASLRKMRVDMLNETPIPACNNCYEKENSGFFSGRRSANKHHGHHIDKVKSTKDDGTLEEFEMSYWDIRFSNLCNLSCRSCGHIFSSSWYQDQVKLAGPEWKSKNKVLNYAGRTETDIWEQLIPHLDYVEQIYFAGGEPLMMAEHYNILDELERRGRFDVRLIYNTNFTHTRLKDRTVFDYWKKFNSVSVGASLDDMGPRAEYIRKGTDWSVIEANRRQMIEVCPEVDFYISPTVSILNADHICEFHRYMVDQGLIRPADLNVNVLQDPPHYRIDIATEQYKSQLKIKFEDHLKWLRPLDPLGRATVGFESLINFMSVTDNTRLIKTFWDKTEQLDKIRNENILDVIPELAVLK